MPRMYAGADVCMGWPPGYLFELPFRCGLLQLAHLTVSVTGAQCRALPVDTTCAAALDGGPQAAAPGLRLYSGLAPVPAVRVGTAATERTVAVEWDTNCRAAR